ncbi:MAG: hypothetical protein PGN11_20340 [Quadrisphaera sp.]
MRTAEETMPFSRSAGSCAALASSSTAAACPWPTTPRLSWTFSQIFSAPS